MMHQGKKLLMAGFFAMTTTSCFTDPAESLRGGPDRLEFSNSSVTLLAGESQVVQVLVRDAQGNVLPVSGANFTSNNTAVVQAAPDTLSPPPGNIYARAVLTAPATGVGTSTVTVTANGLTDDIDVVVAPVTFQGTIAPATGPEGTVMTVTAPAGLTFNTAAVGVTVNGSAAFITSASASAVSFIAPATPGGATTIQIDGVVLAGVGLATLTTSTAINVSSPTEPGNDGPGGGAAIAIPASGSSTVAYGTVDGVGAATGSGSDLDDFFTITTTTAVTLTVTVEWIEAGIDIDGFVLNAAASNFCSLDGCSGASSNDPEVMTVNLAAGTTYNILVEIWDSHGFATPVAYKVTVSQP